jgi:parallel beta-helix repeat protein
MQRVLFSLLVLWSSTAQGQTLNANMINLRINPALNQQMMLDVWRPPRVGHQYYFPTRATTIETFGKSFLAVSDDTWLNVLDYGAYPDEVQVPMDSIDDTTAFLSAIMAAESASPPIHRVYVPPGTYRIGGLLLGSGTELVGAGPGITILKWDEAPPPPNSGTPPLVGTYYSNRAALRDLTIDASGGPTGGNAVFAASSTQFSIERVEIIDAPENGIVICSGDIQDPENPEFSSRSLVRDVVVRSSGLTGLTLTNQSNTLVADSVFADNGNDGIRVETNSSGPVSFTAPCQLDPDEGPVESRNVQIVGNRVVRNGIGTNQGNGISVTWECTPHGSFCLPDQAGAGPKMQVRDVVVSNNVIESNALHGLILQSEFGTVTGNVARRNGSAVVNLTPVVAAGFTVNGRSLTVSGNIARNNYHQGFDLGYCRLCTMTGNIAQANSGVGIEINGTSNTIVSANVVAGNVTSAPESRGGGVSLDAGIFVHGGAAINYMAPVTQDVRIAGNIVRRLGTLQESGIHLVDNAHAQRVVIDDNDVSFAGSDSFSDLEIETQSVVAPNNLTRDTLLGSLPPLAAASHLRIPATGDYFVVSGATGIQTISTQLSGSSLPVAWEGRRVSLRFLSTSTVQTGGNIVLTTGCCSAGDVLDLVYAGGVWRQSK